MIWQIKVVNALCNHVLYAVQQLRISVWVAIKGIIWIWESVCAL